VKARIIIQSPFSFRFDRTSGRWSTSAFYAITVQRKLLGRRAAINITDY